MVPKGLRERRHYRILFANDLDAAGLANLRAVWLPVLGETEDPTVLLGGKVDGTVGAVLGELVSVVRGQGLIPVTTERFS